MWRKRNVGIRLSTQIIMEVVGRRTVAACINVTRRTEQFSVPVTAATSSRTISTPAQVSFVPFSPSPMSQIDQLFCTVRYLISPSLSCRFRSTPFLSVYTQRNMNSSIQALQQCRTMYIIIIIIIINKKITLQPAVAAVQPCQVQQQQAVSLTTEPCVLSVAEYQLLLLACTSPGTVPALYPVTSPVNQNHNFICKFNTWTLAITFMSIISL